MVVFLVTLSIFHIQLTYMYNFHRLTALVLNKLIESIETTKNTDSVLFILIS